MSLEQPVSFLDLYFIAESNTFILGTTILKCWIITISKLRDAGLMEFCCV